MDGKLNSTKVQQTLGFSFTNILLSEKSNLYSQNCARSNKVLKNDGQRAYPLLNHRRGKNRLAIRIN